MSIPTSIAENRHHGGDKDGISSRRVQAYGSFQDSLGLAGTFTGTYTLQKFVQQYGQLAAVGVVAGSLSAPDGTELGMTDRRVTLAVSAVATDSGVVIEIGPAEVNLAGPTHVEPVTLHLIPHPLWGSLCEALLAAMRPSLHCHIAGERLVALLNALLSILEPPDPATEHD